MGQLYTYSGGTWRLANDLHVYDGTAWVPVKKLYAYALKLSTDALAPAEYEWRLVSAYEPPAETISAALGGPREIILPPGTAAQVRVSWGASDFPDVQGYSVGADIFRVDNNEPIGGGAAAQSDGGVSVTVYTTGIEFEVYATTRYMNSAGSGPRTRSTNTVLIPGA